MKYSLRSLLNLNILMAFRFHRIVFECLSGRFLESLVSRLLLLNIAALFFVVTLFLLIPVLPIYLYRDLGASEQEVGLIIPLAFLVSAFLRIPCSLMIRRNIFGVLLLGLALNAAAIAGYGGSWSPFPFAVFRAIHGIAIAINYTLLLTVVELLADPREMERFVASYTAALALGFWVGPSIGVLLRKFAELRSVMFATSGIGLISVFAAILLTRSLRKQSAAGLFEIERLSIGSILKAPNILLASAYLAFSFAPGAIMAYGPLKAKLEFGLSDQLVIIFFLLYYVTAFMVRIILLRSTVIRRIGLGRLLELSLLSSFLGVLVIGLSRDLILFGLGLVSAGLAHGFIFPLTASAVAHATPIKFRVLGNSFHLTAFDIGFLLGSSSVSLLLGFMPLSSSIAAICLIPVLGLIPVRLFSRLEASYSGKR
ncbi:MAG: hypothetical protein DRN59_00355 [Thaumarchaeota archaeon]|nr:MAG: hypothetical protein DRN59_00355 [Nitrososphaerota archaeon]